VEIVLGPHEYGKAETRLVRVDRDGDRHELHDLTVSVALRGDLAAAHLTGDNSAILPTDSQKNTIYAFAGRYGVGRMEPFGLRLARHFVDSQPTISAARVHLVEHPWTRLGPHSFAGAGQENRTAVVTYDGVRATVVAGLTGLVLLNSTDSEFTGFIEDPYTTLAPTTDRILATAVTARWRLGEVPDWSDADWADSYQGVRAALVDGFVQTYSLSLQQTLYAMGERVLSRHPEVVELRLSLPNRHHLPVDLTPFGDDNRGEVFVATDRPYGLIEGTVARPEAAEPGLAWW
jgi:urate oxidase